MGSKCVVVVQLGEMRSVLRVEGETRWNFGVGLLSGTAIVETHSKRPQLNMVRDTSEHVLDFRTDLETRRTLVVISIRSTAP